MLCGTGAPAAIVGSPQPERSASEASRAARAVGVGARGIEEVAFLVGPPASDVLGSEDLWGNPTFVGGVANGGSTSHGIW